MRLGSYDVIAPLGAGGMGEVFRARDSRLGRDVALKVLPDSFAHDPDRLARFEREAQVLASLNHPNIATVHGFERAGDTRALVMELVDGPTLADQIATGPIAVDEALAIARQIVDALDAAHGQGIVHRDLKPANIKIRPDGAVKILDFGLAKALAPEGSDATADAMNSPTLTARATQMGMIIGTAAYMSPEQARGRAVDRRADIWAFGCVLYEMVTGKRLFVGEDLTETLASVVKENPSLEHAPPGFQKLLRKCLEKDPRKRLRDIGDAWELLEPASAPAAAPAAHRPSFVPWLAAALAAVAAVVFGIMLVRRSPAVGAPLVAFEVGWPGDADARFVGGARFFEISPNSRYVAIVHQNALWVRALDAVTPVRIERTQGATYPFWSPDSEQIAFFQNAQLMVVSRAGGSPRTICDAANARGGTWNEQGTIVFAGDYGAAGLLRVAEQGGTPAKVTVLNGQGPTAAAHRYPQFLPDGNRFLYLSLTPDRETEGVYVASLDGMTPARVLDSTFNARFARAEVDGGDGYLLFVRSETLTAQVFDTARLATSGAPFPVAAGVGPGENTGLAAFSVADNGTVAHAEGIVASFDLRWIARTGEPREVVAADVPTNTFAMAPDQKRVAMSLANSRGGFNFDVWVQPPGASPQSSRSARRRAGSSRCGRPRATGSRTRRLIWPANPPTKSGSRRRTWPGSRKRCSSRTPRSISGTGRPTASTSCFRTTAMCTRWHSMARGSPSLSRRGPMTTSTRRCRQTAAGWRTRPGRAGRCRSMSSRFRQPARSGRSRNAAAACPGGGPTPRSSTTAPTTGP
jgi:hypothetical protein